MWYSFEHSNKVEDSLSITFRESNEVEDGLGVTEDLWICKCFYGHFSDRSWYVRHFSIDTAIALQDAA